MHFPDKMILHSSLSNSQLKHLLKHGKITFGGNAVLKIYGTLRCSSGKRMKKANRVFFGIAVEAITAGYRPCGNCMHQEYKKWKAEQIGLSVKN